MTETRGGFRFPLPVHWLLVVTALVCLFGVYLSVWAPFQRRMAVLREIERMHGQYRLEKRGPAWLRPVTGYQRIHGITGNPRIGMFDRVVDVRLSYARRDQSKVTDDFLEKLQVFPHLRELDLRYTKVSDDGIKHIGKLTSLRKLDLGHVRVNGRGFGHLASLRRLETLILSYTPIRDHALEHLKTIRSLRRVSLHACRHLSFEGVEQFQKDRPGCQLYGLQHGGVHLTRK